MEAILLKHVRHRVSVRGSQRLDENVLGEECQAGEIIWI